MRPESVILRGCEHVKSVPSWVSHKRMCTKEKPDHVAVKHGAPISKNSRELSTFTRKTTMVYCKLKANKQKNKQTNPSCIISFFKRKSWHIQVNSLGRRTEEETVSLTLSAVQSPHGSVRTSSSPPWTVFSLPSSTAEGTHPAFSCLGAFALAVPSSWNAHGFLLSH